MYVEFIKILMVKLSLRLEARGHDDLMNEYDPAVGEALAEMMDRRKDTTLQNTLGGLTANDLAIMR